MAGELVEDEVDRAYTYYGDDEMRDFEEIDEDENFDWGD